MWQLSELAHDCERLEAPNVGMDANIEFAIGNWSLVQFDAWQYYQMCGESANPPLTNPGDPRPFTSSIEEANKLVPEGWEVSLYWGYPNSKPEAQLENQAIRDVFGVPVVGQAATPAIALCAAALRANDVVIFEVED